MVEKFLKVEENEIDEELDQRNSLLESKPLSFKLVMEEETK